MRCLDVQLEMEAYVDGELSPEQATLLEQHVADCDGCRAELARLQAATAALETWPLVAEPAQLTARVMGRVRAHSAVRAHPAVRAHSAVRAHPAVPRFRIYWSDLAISLAGAGLAAAVVLAAYYLAPAGLAYLHHTQVTLRLEMLRLEASLLVQHLITTGAVTWGLLSLAGLTLIVALVLAAWDRQVFPAWEPGR
jgi:anti-sigma factor RsiW